MADQRRKLVIGRAAVTSLFTHLPMKHILPLAASLTLIVAPLVLRAETDYPLTEDSKPHADVPKGELIKFQFDQSKVFPGTTRDVTVYVPRQYDGSTPACVYVNQDGVQWNAPTVFDNLIAKKELPVMIGVFVMHGRVKAADGAKALDRFNRSLEYDGLGADYARFVLDELLPAVEQKVTGDGRKIVLSRNGNDRCIGGSSSGAVCAFIAAWERPDAFSRVFSAIGTYVSLRGADRLPGLVRKYEPKPIRVYLQDGSADQNIYGGDWWMANQMMERALTFAGYENAHQWGDGGHNGKQGSALFPDAVRYLWKGWPEHVRTGASGNRMLNEVLIPGENWQLVGEGYKFTEGPAADAKGEVIFNDIPADKTYKIGANGVPVEFLPDSKKANGSAFGPDGQLYMATTADNKVVALAADGKMRTVADNIRGNDITVLANGNIYVTEPIGGGKPSSVWLIKPDGAKEVVDTGLKFANGVVASPDQTLLYVDDSQSHWVYSYQIQPDGKLAHKQRYYWLHEPDTADDSGADGMRVDRDGRLYVATRLGLQVCDQAGRVNVIIPTPNGRVSNLAFGGPEFDTIYATCNDKVFKRKVKVHGAPNFAEPVKPKPPGL
jgi:sugar lactone lactonase YvrE/enterochelin esterase-like enzyme